ncbi:MAG TPA: hypothetical protein VNO30_41930 [Kofleriaceae bacterium]|nr:hypothetical protein [Kofleriaceae bacterium]
MLRKLSVGLFLVLAACGSAKVIQRTQSGGVIELQGDRNKAMEQASQEMAAHCGGPGSYQITQEGEEVIGQDTYVREDTSEASKTSRSGRRNRTDTTTTGQTSTRNATAWRVHYTCGGAAGGPPPGPAGGTVPEGSGQPGGPAN